jgi:exodeoxyribonuclease-5
MDTRFNTYIYKWKFVPKDFSNSNIKLIILDEAWMVPRKFRKFIDDTGIKVIATGDPGQLPPIADDPGYFVDGNIYYLTEIMRQAENSPIIRLEQMVLNDEPLKHGIYGNSCAVIPKKDINEFYFKDSDIILTCTNRLRYNINNFCREEIKKIVKLEYPHIGEKVICRKNNWDKCIDGNIYMTNGMTGYVDYIYRDSFNGKTMTMDFRPDFIKKTFKNVTFSYKHMYEIPGNNDEETFTDIYNDKMEYAYAITVHSSQGSEWDKVLYLHEDMMRNNDDRKKLLYTAISRAVKSIIIVKD